MARMINVETLAKAFAEFLAKSYFGLLRTPTWDDAMNLFDKAPKVDAVEVVRCRNCKHYFDEHWVHIQNTPVLSLPTCTKHSSLLGVHHTLPDGYCHLGERKDNGNDKNTD